MHSDNNGGDSEPLQLDPVPEHLGHILSYNLSDNDDVIKQCSNFNKKANSVISDFRTLNCSDRFKLIITYCYSFYGSNLWCNANNINMLYKSWRICIRKNFNLPWCTHNRLLGILSDSMSIEYILDKRLLKFTCKCLSSSNRDLCQIMRHALISSNSYFGRYSRDKLVLYGLKTEELSKDYIPHVCKAINDIIRKETNEDDAYTGNAIRDLIQIREKCMCMPDFSTNDINFFIQFLCTH